MGGRRTTHLLPYPDHADQNPSVALGRAQGQSLLHLHHATRRPLDPRDRQRVKGIDFEDAKLRVAEILGRRDLIEAKGGQRMDAASLLRPPADHRDEDLAGSYLAYRLGVACDEVPVPSTPAVGWRELPYYDPPTSKEEARAGRPLPLRGVRDDGIRRPASCSSHLCRAGWGREGRPRRRARRTAARREEGRSSEAGQNAAGCAVLWGDPSAPHLLLAEGIETAAALERNSYGNTCSVLVNRTPITGVVSLSRWQRDLTLNGCGLATTLRATLGAPASICASTSSRPTCRSPPTARRRTCPGSAR